MIWYIALGLIVLLVVWFIAAFARECIEPYRDHSIVTFGGGDKINQQENQKN